VVKNRIILLSLSIIFSFFILEVLLIILEPCPVKSYYQYDYDLGFRVRPYAGESNRFGFNDRDYSLQKDIGNYRILVVGDSFNWYGGKGGNYTAMLERKLEEYYGRHYIDVINVGYSMTHTAEQLAILKKYGLRYNPDAVLLGFFAGNDFIDADPYRKRVAALGTFADIDKRTERTFFNRRPILPKPRLYYIIRHYYIIYRERLKLFFETEKKRPLDIRNKDRQVRFTEDTYLRTERDKLEFCNLNAHKEGKFDVQISYIFESLLKMRDLLRKRNIHLIVGIYPDVFQVDEDLQRKLFAKYRLRKEDYDFDLIQKILRKFLDSEGIPYLDLLKEVRNRQKESTLYRFRDGHWNTKGNNLAADLLFKYLLDKFEREAWHTYKDSAGSA